MPPCQPVPAPVLEIPAMSASEITPHPTRPAAPSKPEASRACPPVVSCGFTHTLVCRGGRVYACGKGSAGRLGVGEEGSGQEEDAYVPVLVDSLDNAVSVSAGGLHSAAGPCASAPTTAPPALRPSRSLRCCSPIAPPYPLRAPAHLVLGLSPWDFRLVTVPWL